MRAILRFVAAVFLPIIAFAAEPATGQTEKPALRFLSYEFNPRKPDEVTVGVNVIATGRTHFKAIGETIAGTTFRVKKVVPKSSPGPNGVTKDESELILVDTATGKEVVVILGQTVKSVVPEAK